MSKALVDKQQIETLRALTGEGNRSKVNIPKIVVDYRLDIDEVQNPNFGGFSLSERVKQPDGSFKNFQTPIGKTLECVILRRRNMAKCYDEKTESTTYYTNEFDSWVEPLEVFDIDGNSTGIDFYKTQKERFKLKPSMILYVWYNDNIHRLQLSASSMFSFGDYEKLFEETSICLVKTGISTKRERKSPSSPPYFVATFLQLAEFDYQTATNLVKQLDESLRIYEGMREAKKNPQDREVISVDDLPL